MKISTLLSIILLVCIISPYGNAQVNVNPGAISYLTLKDAFDAINLGTHTGAITIDIAGNTTETATASLVASGIGGASYTSVLISPTGTRTISGAIAGPLVDLNGADNVTINGGNTLTISNTSTSSSASTIRFIADATTNVVSDCILQGSTGAIVSGLGIITFGIGASTGNDNNTINNCTITAAGMNLPLNAIYSMASTAIDNSNITISNNKISNYYNAGLSSAGINCNTGNSAWTITGNSFFQSASRTATTSNFHYGIFITNSGINYTISNNFIGGSLANCLGTAWTMLGTFTNRFVGISVTPLSTATTSIQGNTISNLSTNTNSSASTVSGNFSAINVTSGNADIGTVSGNIIGAITGTGAITVNLQTNTGGVANLISYSGLGIINIKNNKIGAITVTSSTAAVCQGFQGILVSGGTPSIENNTIGNNTVANSINSSSLTTGINTATVVGINVTSGVVNTTSISNNIIANINQNRLQLLLLVEE